MNEPGVAELGGATPGAGIAADTSIQMHEQCRNEELCTKNANEASKLHTETAESRTSTAAAKPLNQHANQMPNKSISNQQIESYMKGLDAGDATAMYELACCCLNNSISDDLVHRIADNKRFKEELNTLAKNYALGFAEPDNDEEAFELFRQTENLNDPDILCAIGRAYRFGWGVNEDIDSAIKYYIKATEFGSYEAMQRLEECRQKYVPEQLEMAFEHFKQLADALNIEAQFAIGYCYYHWIGVHGNYDLAIDWLQSAAYNGCSNAMALLGEIYESDPLDDEKKSLMLEYYRQATAMRNSQARFKRALCYKKGLGVAKNFKQAVLWFEKAAKQGHSTAAYWAGYCYEYGCGVLQNKRKAFEYYKQAAIAGYGQAQYSLGTCYHKAVGTPKNYRKAVFWIEKSTDQQCDSAAFLTSEFNEKSQDALLSPEAYPISSFASETTDESVSNAENHGNADIKAVMAFTLAKLAASKKCEKAHELVGDCYYSGICVAKSVVSASLSYKRANMASYVVLLKLASCYASWDADASEVDAFAVIREANVAIRSEIDAFLREMQ